MKNAKGEGVKVEYRCYKCGEYRPVFICEGIKKEMYKGYWGIDCPPCGLREYSFGYPKDTLEDLLDYPSNEGKIRCTPLSNKELGLPDYSSIIDKLIKEI